MVEITVPETEDSNIVESEPVYTSPTPKPEPKVESEEVNTKEAQPETPEEETPVDTESEGEQTKDDKSEESLEEPKAKDVTIDAKFLQNLKSETQYQATDIETDILDEYGNLDPKKFSEFMVKNNEHVFNQAITAVEARKNAVDIESQSWDDVYKEYPEVKDNESLESAIKGARLQDIISGGSGDLKELAKKIVAPMRKNKIEAIESVNKTIKSQESLSSFKPEVAATEKVSPSLLEQLKQARLSGDNDLASRITHAIRIERIYGKAKE